MKLLKVIHVNSESIQKFIAQKESESDMPVINIQPTEDNETIDQPEPEMDTLAPSNKSHKSSTLSMHSSLKRHQSRESRESKQSVHSTTLHPIFKHQTLRRLTHRVNRAHSRSNSAEFKHHDDDHQVLRASIVSRPNSEDEEDKKMTMLPPIDDPEVEDINACHYKFEDTIMRAFTQITKKSSKSEDIEMQKNVTAISDTEDIKRKETVHYTHTDTDMLAPPPIQSNSHTRTNSQTSRESQPRTQTKLTTQPLKDENSIQTMQDLSRILRKQTIPSNPDFKSPCFRVIPRWVPVKEVSIAWIVLVFVCVVSGVNLVVNAIGNGGG